MTLLVFALCLAGCNNQDGDKTVDEDSSKYFLVHYGKCGHGIVFDDQLTEIRENENGEKYILCPECGEPVIWEEPIFEDQTTGEERAE